MTLENRADLLAYLLDLVDADGIAQSLDISAHEVEAWKSSDDFDDEFTGALLAFARERFKPKIGPDLQRIAKEHRAKYMREYMRARRAGGLVDREHDTQAAYRQRNRDLLRRKSAEHYAGNQAEILKRREERRRESALAELFAITTKIDKENP